MWQAGQLGRKKWALALIVSLLVHGLAILGLSRCSASRLLAEPTAIDMDLVCMSDDQPEGGAAIQLEPRPLDLTFPRSPNDQKSTTAVPLEPFATAASPFAGTVVNPFDLPSGLGGVGDGHGAGAGAGHGNAVFFGVPAQGRRIVYVLDCSGSMGKNGALAAARAELVRSLKSLPEDVRFQIIVYHDVARPLLARQPGWFAPAAVHEVIEALARLPAEGATNHAVGLRAGLQLQPDVMFFLTDADDVTQEHLRLALQLNPRNRTAIHTIELNLANIDRPTMPMQVLARLTGGAYQAVDLAKYR